MALDSRFVLAYWASDFFVNKDSASDGLQALPLANGVVTFYRDSARTQLKNIYTLSGIPPYSTASYVALPNPMTLSPTGNPQDANGNNVDIYFFPFEGTPADGNDTVDLYYITSYSEQGVLQFTRSAIPNLNDADAPPAGEEILNFVPNGQFLLHNSGQSNGSTSDGKIQKLITNIAPGGWTFERPTNNATDIVTFYRFGVPLSGVPSGNPRYGFQLQCASPSAGDPYKHLRLKFNNSNRFASTTQSITFSFTGQSLSTDFDVSIYLIRNFGTGGSAAPPFQLIGTATLTNTFEIFNFSFLPGVNTGATIGLNDDDYIQFAIAYPTSTASNSVVTDFVISPGTITVTAFPETTNAEFLSATLPGNQVPDYDGYDLGLPIRMTRDGYASDQSFVGKIFPIAHEESKLDWAEVLCDGSGYITNNYTPEGIPYARLQDKIFNSAGFPLFGTSPDFVVSNLLDAPGFFTINTNQAGAQTATANGTTAFTITAVGTGSALYGVTGFHYWQSANTVATIVCNTVGKVTYAADVSTGCTIKQIRSESNAYSIFTVDTNTSTITGGQKFTFSTPSTNFYVWFKVGGVGLDPGGPGTAILINLPASPSKQDIAAAIVSVLSGSTYTSIAATPSPTAGQYFSFYSNSKQYVVYYVVNSVGNDPAIPGAISIPVNLPAAPTATQVANNTKLAINKYSFAVPDLRGVTIRGLDSTGIWDIDYLTRLSKLPRGTNSIAGSIELDSILHHEHAVLGAAGSLTPDTEYGVVQQLQIGVFPTDIQIRGDSSVSNYFVLNKMLTISRDDTQKYTYAELNSNLNNAGETRGINIALNYSIHL